ncbi:Lamin-like protein [Linum perenne]
METKLSMFKSPLLIVVVLCATMASQVSAKRYTVGGNMGWTSNVNYSIWAQDKHFYNDDWLFFVYDRNQNNVLEVNKTNYENCNADNFLHNWTTGAGRDVVPLNVTRHYYFISGKGFCYGGMKLALRVEKHPPPPTASPVKSDSAPSIFGLGSSSGRYVLPAVFAIGALWDGFVHLW